MANERKKMIQAFRQKIPPTNFLSSFFKTDPMWFADTETVEIDIERDNQKIAIDVTPYSNGHLNVQKRWTTKEYNPPSFNEYDSYNAKELLKRIPGQNAYSNASPMDALLARITDDQVRLRNKILRSMEKMASDVLFSGVIDLINDDQIDYKQKSALKINAAADWGGGSATIPVDLQGLVTAIKKNGKVTATDLIFGETAWTNFLTDASMLAQFNYRRVNLVDIAPPVKNISGAAFHGVISIGSYQLRCWTYPEYYDIPTDAEIGLPSGTITSAGSTGVPYVPLTKVLGIAAGIDLRWVFGGIATVADAVDPRLRSLFGNRVPSMVAADFLPYAEAEGRRSITVGVESRPMPVPTQIDGFGWLETDI